MTIGRFCFWLCVFSLIGWVASLSGCEGTSANYARTCDIPQDATIGYMDCGVSGCVAGCGVLPPDGSPGWQLPPGCFVDIGTSATVHSLCVTSCGECR